MKNIEKCQPQHVSIEIKIIKIICYLSLEYIFNILVYYLLKYNNFSSVELVQGVKKLVVENSQTVPFSLENFYYEIF